MHSLLDDRFHNCKLIKKKWGVWNLLKTNTCNVACLPNVLLGLRANGVRSGNSTCIWGSGIHCLNSPSFGGPTGLESKSPTQELLMASHADHLLPRTSDLIRLRIIAEHLMPCYQSLFLLRVSLWEVLVKEQEETSPPPVRVVWQHLFYFRARQFTVLIQGRCGIQSNK